MGITYFACAYPAEFTGLIFDNPMVALTVNPTLEGWSEETGTELATLDLDKAWRSFQATTAPGPKITGFEYPRPAHRMFEGDITEVYSGDIGWFPWIRAISPDETAVISRDLEKLEVEPLIASEQRRYGGSEHENRYCAELLERAQAFTRTLTRLGHGFVYSIG